jgi:hypothetical protein
LLLPVLIGSIQLIHFLFAHARAVSHDVSLLVFFSSS